MGCNVLDGVQAVFPEYWGPHKRRNCALTWPTKLSFWIFRRERGVFDTIYKKLERELQEKKKEMAFIIEVSNIAYEERSAHFPLAIFCVANFFRLMCIY